MSRKEMDKFFIRQTFDLAEKSAEKGFDPFAALLVVQGKIVASSMDKCIQYSDPTAHAELILISEFCREHQLISLEGYTLYCNVEPCVMCSGAIHWAKISRVVFGVGQSALQTLSKGKPKPSCEELINIGKHKIEIKGPVLPEEGLLVLKKYPFQSKKERHAQFFKKNNFQKSNQQN
ncbi:MAG: nucleoside deaminase [Bacteroidota bacterium]